MKKILSLLLIIFILSSVLLFTIEKISNASYNSKFANYPGYKELIEDLQKDHPNWKFEIYETNLEWANVLKAETVARHGRSLVQKCDGVWNCQVAGCKNVQYEPGWYCASPATVSYYLDPRNSICEDYIFQFEQLTYDSKQTEDGVKKILADCNYMQGKITYTNTAGSKQTINKTYSQVIMEAAKAYNVSPYHIASRIRQEQGTGNGSAMISGTYGSYRGYYNYFNWGAYGTDIMGSGLATAKKYGWDNPEKAIKGGIQFIAQSYINCGQDTLYFQKFDVVDGGDGYYGHQYMTNISASKTEGATVRSAYLKMGMLTKDSTMTFKIPVYKNMPTAKAAMPGKETLVTQDVNTNAVTNIIKEKVENGQIIAKVNKGTKMLRIELAPAKGPGKYFWDKVVLSDGTVGYAVRNNLTQISLQSNYNKKYIALKTVELRNGPGTTKTDIMKYIYAGQMLTVVEKDKYTNLNGQSWYRIKLTDGDYGYIAIGSTKDPNVVPYDETSTEYGYVEVTSDIGINIRSTPTTNGNNIITAVPKGTQLFRLQKNVSTNQGYTWDKVVTTSGIVGYAVRIDVSSGAELLKPIVNDNISGTGFKTTNSNLIAQPNVTVAQIKKAAQNVVIKKGNTVIADNQNIGTGYTITANGKTYTALVLGDVNGDGKVNTGDTLAMSQHIEKYKSISDKNYIQAADVNRDGKVNTGDSLALRQHVENFKTIKY